VLYVWFQAFHTLYHTDESVLLGAPTGSGKTISAELAMLRVFRAHPGMKVIYIAPLKVHLATPLHATDLGYFPMSLYDKKSDFQDFFNWQLCACMRA
jgi:hypothetical protein